MSDFNDIVKDALAEVENRKTKRKKDSTQALADIFEMMGRSEQGDVQAQAVLAFARASATGDSEAIQKALSQLGLLPAAQNDSPAELGAAPDRDKYGPDVKFVGDNVYLPEIDDNGNTKPGSHTPLENVTGNRFNLFVGADGKIHGYKVRAPEPEARPMPGGAQQYRLTDHTGSINRGMIDVALATGQTDKYEPVLDGTGVLDHFKERPQERSRRGFRIVGRNEAF